MNEFLAVGLLLMAAAALYIVDTMRRRGPSFEYFYAFCLLDVSFLFIVGNWISADSGGILMALPFLRGAFLFLYAARNASRKFLDDPLAFSDGAYHQQSEANDGQ